jgi:hypothetical protein
MAAGRAEKFPWLINTVTVWYYTAYYCTAWYDTYAVQIQPTATVTVTPPATVQYRYYTCTVLQPLWQGPFSTPKWLS